MKNKKAILVIFLVTITAFVLPISNEFRSNKGYKTALTRSCLSVVYAKNKEAVKADQADQKEIKKIKGKDESENKGMLTKVMIVVMIIWFGLAFYLFRLDRKISKLEKEINEL